MQPLGAQTLRIHGFGIGFKNMRDTLESGINVPLRLSILGIFSRGYSLITDLKDLNFTSLVCMF